MKIDGSKISCGVMEIYGLLTRPLSIIEKIFQEEWRDSYIFAFSDADYKKNGVRLANYIKANRLGEIVETSKVINPNSGNVIQAWLWVFDRAAVGEFLKGKTNDE